MDIFFVTDSTGINSTTNCHHSDTVVKVGREMEQVTLIVLEEIYYDARKCISEHFYFIYVHLLLLGYMP